MPEILNKKQLEDAFNCLLGSCEKCSCNGLQREHGIFDCMVETIKTALAYRDMLERLEWSMPEDRWGGDYCPMCGNSDLEGHTADCELAALLKESEEGMERKEIIDGLKDLIKDRESFITEGEPESWKTDTDKIFEHDKQVLEEAINTIEAQQQEIDRLEVQVEADKDLIRELNNSYINSELNLSALISDKDEQARKTRQLEEGLRSTLKVLETLNYRGGLGLDIHKWLRDEMQTVNALLGGKEDARRL